MTPDPRVARAARHLFEAHRARTRFAPLAGDLAPCSDEEAYAIQDAFVALRCEAERTRIAGYKIAITTPAMRRFVGFDDSIAGVLLERQVHRSDATVRTADYTRLLVECEIAFEIGTNVPARGAPHDRASIASHVEAAMPAFELADDRNAEYAGLAASVRSLMADNAWNEGAVLGAPVRAWRDLDLAAARGVVTINDAVAGEGHGRDVLGHPLDALAWLANHLNARGKALEGGQVVITGSVVASKFPQAGDRLRFAVEGVGAVAIDVA